MFCLCVLIDLWVALEQGVKVLLWPPSGGLWLLRDSVQFWWRAQEGAAFRVLGLTLHSVLQNQPRLLPFSQQNNTIWDKVFRTVSSQMSRKYREADGRWCTNSSWMFRLRYGLQPCCLLKEGIADNSGGESETPERRVQGTADLLLAFCCLVAFGNGEKNSVQMSFFWPEPLMQWFVVGDYCNDDCIFYLRGSRQVLLLGMRCRFVSSGSFLWLLWRGFRKSSAVAFRKQPCFLPLRLCTVKHNTACRVSLFGFIMDISKLLNYWRETHVSLKGKSLIWCDYPEPVSVTVPVTWPSGLYIAALPVAS